MGTYDYTEEMRSKSNEALYEIVRHGHEDGYVPEALDIAAKELANREIPPE